MKHKDKLNKNELKKDELLFAARAAHQSLSANTNSSITEILAFLEGMAQFLDKKTIIDMKCKKCDHYAPSFFPIENDFDVVDSHEFCHEKKQPLHHLTLFTIAKCMKYSEESKQELLKLADAIVKEHLQPYLEDKKLYDPREFTSYDLEFDVKPSCGMVCIEFGHSGNGKFVGGDIKLYLLKRLDPGLGDKTKKIIEKFQKNKPIIVVNASQKMRRSMDLDDVLENIAKKRDMDLVYT
jgi:hypothetical protein